MYAYVCVSVCQSAWPGTNPAATAPATAKPRAADFPRPRAARHATVLCSDLSKIASRNVRTTFPFSITKGYDHEIKYHWLMSNKWDNWELSLPGQMYSTSLLKGQLENDQ